MRRTKKKDQPLINSYRNLKGLFYKTYLWYPIASISFYIAMSGDFVMAWDPKDFKKPSLDELKAKLTPEQFKVTQKEGTEPPFKNEYWDNKQAGIYVDRVSGEPLFSSIDKYDSGTGWPSFSKPLVEKNIETRVDRKLFVKRTEVRSKHGDSHLGHVFDDGPKPTGKRYCMNSAALRFIPADRLEAEGYPEFTALFKSVPAK